MNMQFASTHKYAKFGRGSVSLVSRNSRPLDLGAIASACPSVLATEAHHSRSDRYTYVSTMEVMQALGGEGFHPYSIMQGGSKDEEKRGFTKHLIRFRSESQAVARGDSQFEVVMLGSHDGTTSTQLFGGFFRGICNNGTIWFNGEAVKVRVPHVGNIVPQVIDGAYTVVKQAPQALEQMDNFRRIELNRDERIAFARAAAQLRFEEESPVSPEAMLVTRRSADNQSDLHTTFNVVQENVIRGGLSYVGTRQTSDGITRPVQRSTRPVRGVEGDVRLNRALCTLAEEMAKIKNAA